MADWVDVQEDEWVDVPEGGAEGGGGSDKAPSKSLMRRALAAPAPHEEGPTDKRMRERYEALSRKVDMSRGAALEFMDPDDQEFYRNYRDKEALGRFVSGSRGVPFTGGHIDELSALLQTGKTDGPEYQSKLNNARQAVNQSVEEHPLMPLVGTMLFAPAGPGSALGRIGVNTLAGVSEGVGAAPNMSEAPKAGALGGGSAALMSLLAEAPLAGARALGGRAQKIKDATNASELAAETERRTADLNSAIGSVGRKTADSMKTWERLQDALNNPAASAENRAAAQAFLDSEEGRELYNQVLRNYVEDAPAQMGRLSTARDARAAAAAANDPDLIRQAAEGAAEAKLNDPRGVTNRLAEMARRYVPPAVGTAVGGAPGAVAGAAVAGSMGKPGTIMSNMMKSPSMYRPLMTGETALRWSGRGMSGAAPAVARGALDPYLEHLEPEESEPWESFIAKGAQR